MYSGSHEIIERFDKDFIFQDMKLQILGRRIEIEALFDSKTVFDVIVKM